MSAKILFSVFLFFSLSASSKGKDSLIDIIKSAYNNYETVYIIENGKTTVFKEGDKVKVPSFFDKEIDLVIFSGSHEDFGAIEKKPGRYSFSLTLRILDGKVWTAPMFGAAKNASIAEVRKTLIDLAKKKNPIAIP
jgi:hypothetical protein